jgi:hypothetical protein
MAEPVDNQGDARTDGQEVFRAGCYTMKPSLPYHTIHDLQHRVSEKVLEPRKQVWDTTLCRGNYGLNTPNSQHTRCLPPGRHPGEECIPASEECMQCQWIEACLRIPSCLPCPTCDEYSDAPYKSAHCPALFFRPQLRVKLPV